MPSVSEVPRSATPPCSSHTPPAANTLLFSPSTTAGELDLSLAQRNQTPVPALKKFPAAAGTVPGTVPRPKARRDGKSLPGKVASKPAEASGCRGGGGGGAAAGAATKVKSPRSAVGIAWEAFKANGGGDSLPATLSAAVTATSIAVEHVRKRTRERLLLEKGAGTGKRLTGPVQITLEDLQVRRWGRRPAIQ